MLADFQQFYQLDLADLWRGSLEPRRALVLAGQLGSTVHSRFRAIRRGGIQFVGWGPTTNLVADLFDRTTAIAHAVAGNDTPTDLFHHRGIPAPQPITQARTVADFDVDGFMRQLTR